MSQVLKPQDLYKFKSTGDPQVSPDGTSVLFVVSQADKKSDKNLTNIWIMEISGKKPRRLTASGKDRFPRWSPDGKRFAFVSDRSGKAQIWIMEKDGGEPFLLSTEQTVASAPLWSPDGKYIVFVARDFTKDAGWVPYPGAPEWDAERARLQAAKALSSNANSGQAQNTDRVSDVKVITRFRYRFDGIGYLGDLRRHVFIVRVPETPPESGEVAGHVRRLTCGDYDHGDPAFSPDGKYLVVAALRCENADYMDKQDLWVIEVSTGRMVQVMDGEGPCRSPMWSPDGKKIAFAGHDRSYGGSTTEALWVLDIERFMTRLESGGVLSTPAPYSMKEAFNVTRKLDRPLGNPVSSDVRYTGEDKPFSWENEDTLLFLACDKGATGLYRAALCGGISDAVITCLMHDPAKNVSAFHKSGGTTIVQAGSCVEPDNIYLFNEKTDSSVTEPDLTCLVHSNPWLRQVELGNVERFTFKSDKGWDIDGWLLYSSGYERGRKYPTVLFIHGGPHGVYGSAFMFQCQIFASSGYAVLYTNPRGSQSYGQEFASACVEDWGGSDFKDIMAGVDHVIATGVADPENLFVTGWSYGGFMTSWIITQTKRFKAAVAGAIVSNRYSMYGTSDIPFFSEHQCGGVPWEAREKYFDRSPISYAANVETPVMFIHGEGDLRCPISQSEEFYLTLKRLGKTAVMVRYPGEFHGFVKPSHKFDRFERTLSWFNYYAGK